MLCAKCKAEHEAEQGDFKIIAFSKVIKQES
jgi:hypothetical protein